jgi:(p)ppGpp synthase/HD superfamily hydrolase
MNRTRYTRAVAMATAAHAGVFRKGTTVPYISHPLAVSAMAMEYGGDEDVAIAAVLHDVVEDAGREYIVPIREEFGLRVADLVMAVSNIGRGSWREKKVEYLAHLARSNDDVLLIAGSDKLHNARAIVSDGPTVFAKFKAPKEDVLWYYTELAAMFNARGAPMASALSETVNKMKEL